MKQTEYSVPCNHWKVGYVRVKWESDKNIDEEINLAYCMGNIYRPTFCIT